MIDAIVERAFAPAREAVARGDVPGATRESFLRFDLTNVADVNAAKLLLTGKLKGRGAVESQLGVFAVDDTTWTESSLTFDSRPITGEAPLATATITREACGRSPVPTGWLTCTIRAHSRRCRAM